ncbi:hypothetical protein CLAIMM_14698 [Cladophialophora immunda]|nr:hypothetical protein CLAIMM_14698 [Cladophialophora immunda]
MASQPEGSTPFPPLEGWTFVNSDSESEFSNSSSLEELFEQNRLHLTVNPLDPFLPTIRPTNNLPYVPVFPDAPQYASPIELDSGLPDTAAETDLNPPDTTFPDLNPAVPGTEFRPEDYFEGDFLADFHFADYGTPAQEPFVNADHYDFLDLGFVLQEPANDEVVPADNRSQAAQSLTDLDTFDPDFWFSHQTELDIGSPLPLGVSNNAPESRFPLVPEEVQLQPRPMNSLADFFGYSELLAPQASNSAPQDPLADAFVNPQDYGVGYRPLSPPRPVPMPQFPQALQQELPELDFSHLPVVNSELGEIDFTRVTEYANTAGPSNRSAPESAPPPLSASSSRFSNPSRAFPQPTGYLRHSEKWYEEGVQRQREAAARARRLAHRRENHQQHKQRVREVQQRERESRRLHRPLNSRYPLDPAIPRAVPAQQAPTPVVHPAPTLVATPGTTVEWYRKEETRTGAFLGYVRRVEQFYTHLPPSVAAPVVRVPVPLAPPVPAVGAPVLMPLRRQAPMPPSTQPAAPAFKKRSRRVVVIDDSDSYDDTPRRKAPRVKARSQLRRSERLCSRGHHR